MDCRTCQPSLIDLLHGELALEAAEQARAHIAHCTNCKGALDKLTQGLQLAQQLPLQEPPQAVSARLLQLADEQARRAAAARKPRGAPSVWQALLDFVGRFAAGRQVGMVTIMLLIVAVGLWSLPQLKHTPIAAGGTVVHPDESEEAAPSTGVEPAQPLDLKVDLRAGRIRSRDELAQPAAAAEPPATPELAAAPAEAEALQRTGSRQSRGAALSEKARARSLDPAAGLAPPPPAASEGSARRAMARAPSKPSTSAPAAFPQNAAPKAAEQNRPSGQGLRDDEGVAAASAERETKEAKKEGGAVLGELDSARTYAGPKGCGSAALTEYDRVVRAAPRSPEAGAALIEMGRCAQARGDAQRARALFERAALIEETAKRAKDLLARVPAPAPAQQPAAAPAAASAPPDK